jgi:hypothetical protein
MAGRSPIKPIARNALVLGIVASLMALATASAQPPGAHDHGSHGAKSEGGYGGGIVVSTKARAQLDAARAELLSKYGTPEKATAAGWNRPNSSTPTMGEHWGNPALHADPAMDPLKPEVLMFAPIAGELKLVGASWIKRQPKEAGVPKLFDGMDNMWHRHDATDPLNRAIAASAEFEGEPMRRNADGIVMNHLWFIDAQDGEFTGHNHWMPFMDAGLPVPPPSIKGEVLGQAAVAIGEVNGSAFIVGRGYNPLPDAAKKQVDALRADIKALFPEYRAAHARNDAPAMVSILGDMGAIWTDIRAIHTRELRPQMANLLDVAYGNMIAGHDHGPGGHH